MKRMDFRHDQDLRKKTLAWWGSLESRRGDRSELSRCTSIDMVFRVAAFYRFKNLLQDYKIFDPALARTVAVLSMIRLDHENDNLAMMLQRAGLKFERLKGLEKNSMQDRVLQEFRRLVKFLKSKAPVLQTADVVYWWEVRKPNREFFSDFFQYECVR